MRSRQVLPLLVFLVLAAATAGLGVFTNGATARVIMRPRTSFDPRVRGAIVVHQGGPPAISGGTLLALRDGHRLVVADPDRDRVLVVDLDLPAERAVTGRVEPLRPGAEPGRSVEDAAGRVHTVMRGVGAILDFDPASVAGARRRSVCPSPRGIAYEAGTDSLHVACAGGELVTLPARGGRATRTLTLARGLRDVVVSGGQLYVTRFRSAEVLVVSADGASTETLRPPPVAHDDVSFRSGVAWRALALPGGKVTVLHQLESEAEIIPAAGGYGSFFQAGCEGIVRSAATVFDSGSRQKVELAGVPLPVDFAFDLDAQGEVARVAVVGAANQSGVGAVKVFEGAWPGEDCRQGVARGEQHHELRNATAVAYANHRLVTQTRTPARLVVDGSDSSRTIDLGGEETFDTGHAIFHTSTPVGLACASCHPEGMDDGHTWRFHGIGPRRTPALHSLGRTRPFHWDGDMSDMHVLLREVFTGRMRGEALDLNRAGALEGWLGHLRPPRARVRDANAVARGQALYGGRGACASCHDAEPRARRGAEDVGTGQAFQIPTLVGVSHRLPVMHDGCARTLRARFEPECGGERHGPALEASEIADLVAYMESL